MDEKNLSKYEYLWNGKRPGWVLLRAPDLPGGFCVVHKVDRTLLHVDDANLNVAVCEEMLKRGCEVLERMPSASVQVCPK